MNSEEFFPRSAGPAAFLTTRWSLVVRAGEEVGKDSQTALEQLCRDYWYPLYAFARRRGMEVQDAQDFTQGFFLHMLEAGTLTRARAEMGRFRTFLLGALQNYLSNERRNARAQKRGGGREPLSLEAMAAEERFALEPADSLTPEMQYERSWAFALLERVGQRLRGEYERAGRLALFERLEPYLAGKANLPGSDDLALRLGMSTGALRVALHRMRRRYGDLLRAEIMETVTSPEEAEQEIAHLFQVMAHL